MIALSACSFVWLPAFVKIRISLFPVYRSWSGCTFCSAINVTSFFLHPSFLVFFPLISYQSCLKQSTLSIIPSVWLILIKFLSHPLLKIKYSCIYAQKSECRKCLKESEEACVACWIVSKSNVLTDAPKERQQKVYAKLRVCHRSVKYTFISLFVTFQFSFFSSKKSTRAMFRRQKKMWRSQNITTGLLNLLMMKTILVSLQQITTRLLNTPVTIIKRYQRACKHLYLVSM